jgi:hypothetical protein
MGLKDLREDFDAQIILLLPLLLWMHFLRISSSEELVNEEGIVVGLQD